MKAYQTLPEGYQEIAQIRLSDDKKASRMVNGLALGVGVALIVIGHLVYPLQDAMQDFDNQYVAVLVGFVVYMVVHELTHAAVMKLAGAKKVKFGMSGIFFYAGSEDYFDKPAYRLVGLTPIVLWGVVLAVATVLVPRDWFWVAWILQIANLSGSMGDVYIMAKLWNYPDTYLAYDTGINETIYDKVA